MASISENVRPCIDSITSDLDALEFPGMKAMVDFDELRSSVPDAWLQGINSELPAVAEMFQGLRNHMLQNPQAPLDESLRKPVPVVQMINDPELDGDVHTALLMFREDKQVLKKLGKPLLAEALNYDDDDGELVSEGRKALKFACDFAQGFQTDQRMASGSEKTLPCPDSSKITLPALAPKVDALDFPAMKALEEFQTCFRELGEKMCEDPAYIQELRSCDPAAKFDQEQLSNTLQMFQRLQDNARQDPRASLENLGKPGALEEFAERLAQLRKDPEAEPILAELDARPTAYLKFWDDKQVLKKLGKSMLSSQGLNYDADDEELVSEGGKALEIVIGYAKMKCYRILLDAQRKKANKVEGKKKTTSRHASKSGKTKRSSLLSNKCDDAV